MAWSNVTDYEKATELLIEKVDQLQAENKKLREEMDKWNLSTKNIAKNIAKDLSFEAENKRLREALVRFGSHDSPCEAFLDIGDKCICGFDKARKQ